RPNRSASAGEPSNVRDAWRSSQPVAKARQNVPTKAIKPLVAARHLLQLSLSLAQPLIQRVLRDA
ncbi:hypothetical protein K9U74_34440, partial [Pseudomonas aeruginosa]|uniref:hypothetical protein n=1 Tax=Pseudomonas aeruginosa TaxID=287 RepID=UPI001F06CF20